MAERELRWKRAWSRLQAERRESGRGRQQSTVVDVGVPRSTGWVKVSEEVGAYR